MTAICRTPEELLAELNRLTIEAADYGTVQVQRQVTEFMFATWAAGKFTWSRFQADDVWSGQSRASIRVSIGAPDGSYEPDNPGDWPHHGNPYPAPDVFQAMGKLDGLRAYQTVYLSDNAPHYDKVEARTQVGRAAAEFTRSHFGSGYSWGNSLIPDNIPF